MIGLIVAIIVVNLTWTALSIQQTSVLDFPGGSHNFTANSLLTPMAAPLVIEFYQRITMTWVETAEFPSFVLSLAVIVFAIVRGVFLRCKFTGSWQLGHLALYVFHLAFFVAIVAVSLGQISNPAVRYVPLTPTNATEYSCSCFYENAHLGLSPTRCVCIAGYFHQRECLIPPWQVRCFS